MDSPRCFSDLAELIDYHLRLHEGVEVRDIYKLLHQSVFGPEHLGEGVTIDAIAVEMQEAEEVDFDEPLIEPISVDGEACRINLRLAKKQDIPAQLISQATFRSAPAFPVNTARLDILWREFRDSLEKLSVEYSLTDYEEISNLAGEKGFPPLHHSDRYRNLNRPAYRVLMAADLGPLMRERRVRGR